MIVNAPLPQLIGQQYQRQRQESVFMEALRQQPNQTSYQANMRDNQSSQPNAPSTFNRQQQQHQDSTNQMIRFDEDASEILNFVLNGGPKWGFRIKQLNDNRVIVSRVNKGPAEKCGLKTNDEILSVNNVTLLNKPRSLLLHDYPDQLAVAASSSDKTALLDTNNKENILEATIASDAYLGPINHPIELSKLDFAYQLIKHSSISNKLMLTVKRYLNPAYARASVAATNLTNSASLNDEYRRQSEELEKKNSHNSGVQYAYKCCECYCDNEGKYRLVSSPLLLIPFYLQKTHVCSMTDQETPNTVVLTN